MVYIWFTRSLSFLQNLSKMSTTYPLETTNGTVTSWMPLTTGWPYVPACKSRYVIYEYEPITRGQDISDKSTISYSRVETSSVYVAYHPFWRTLNNTHEQCLPDAVVIWRSQFFFDTNGEWQQDKSLLIKMSLAPLTCSNFWSTVATFIKSDISTQVMCCPP